MCVGDFDKEESLWMQSMVHIMMCSFVYMVITIISHWFWMVFANTFTIHTSARWSNGRSEPSTWTHERDVSNLSATYKPNKWCCCIHFRRNIARFWMIRWLVRARSSKGYRMLNVFFLIIEIENLMVSIIAPFDNISECQNIFLKSS